MWKEEGSAMITYKRNEWSIDEHVQFIQFLNILLDLAQLFLVGLLSALASSRVNQSNMGMFLVLSVDLVPFSFQPLPDLTNFLLG